MKIISVFIYIVSILLSTFAVSGINFNNVFKKNYKFEAKIFVILISLALGYLVGSFLIDFLNLTEIL